MAEEHDLQDPQYSPTIVVTSYKIRAIHMEFDAVDPMSVDGKSGILTMMLKDNNGKYLQCKYYGDKATTLMKQLNTGNFTQTSMQKRLLKQLEADGIIPPGNVTGQPDPAPPLD